MEIGVKEILAAIIFLVGLGQFHRPTMERMLRGINELKGVKSKITPDTVLFQKVLGVIFIIIAIFLFLE